MRVIESAGYDNFLIEREDTEEEKERYIAHVSFLVTYHFPTTLLSRVAEDIEDQLADEDDEKQGGDAAAAAKAVRAAPVSGQAGVAVSSKKRDRSTVDDEAPEEQSSGVLVELRRRRRRNRAGQYVLEYELRPARSADGLNERREVDAGPRWVSLQRYEELFSRDRVVEDSVVGEDV